MYGGIPIAKDKEMLRKTCPHILIGTPGRLLALTRGKDLKLGKCSHVVIDECDKCLEKVDMRRDIQQLFVETPKKKQVISSSSSSSSSGLMIFEVSRGFLAAADRSRRGASIAAVNLDVWSDYPSRKNTPKY